MKSRFKKNLYAAITMVICFCVTIKIDAQKKSDSFKVIAFYTAKRDTAHISFVHEANKWFPEIAKENNFIYNSTNDWNNLNASFLSNYKVVLFFRYKTGRFCAACCF